MTAATIVKIIFVSLISMDWTHHRVASTTLIITTRVACAIMTHVPHFQMFDIVACITHQSNRFHVYISHHCTCYAHNTITTTAFRTYAFNGT